MKPFLNIVKNKLPFVTLASASISWILLGGYRGYSLYQYNNYKQIKEHEEREKENQERIKMNLSPHYTREPEKFYYVDALVNVTAGALFYINPIFLPFTVYREIYRLEVKTRNLTNEMEKDDYYKLVF